MLHLTSAGRDFAGKARPQFVWHEAMAKLAAMIIRSDPSGGYDLFALLGELTRYARVSGRDGRAIDHFLLQTGKLS
jgi:hypothetical protein